MPASVLEGASRDLLARSRMLVFGSFALALVAMLFIPPTLLIEGMSVNNLVLLLGGVGMLAAPFVFRFTESLIAATGVAVGSVALTLWFGAYFSGGFEASTLRALAVVPLVATFIVNARFGIGLAVLMALSIEVFYYADLMGYPFREPPSAEGERWFSAQAAVAELAFVTGFAWLFEASRREFTERLQASADRSQSILNHMEDGIALFGADGKLARTNRAFARLLGLDGGPHASGAVAVGVHSDLMALSKRVVLSRKTEQIHFKLPDNRMGSAVASPIIDDEELGATGAVLLIRDVTMELEIDRMKTDFIASVSHELRTPLTSILGFTKLTQNKLESRVFPNTATDEAKVAKAVKTIRNNLRVVLVEGDRLTAMINDVLDISKMEAGAMEWARDPVAPDALVERTLAATAALFADKTKSISVDVEVGLPALVGDFNRLQQVLINLISNAAKYAHQRVEVSVRTVEDGVEFAVVDDGRGIEAAQLTSVFEKFRQLKGTQTTGPTGTGLGLPISKQIVTAHGGQIRVESEPGNGARFVMTLPLGGD